MFCHAKKNAKKAHRRTERVYFERKKNEIDNKTIGLVLGVKPATIRQFLKRDREIGGLEPKVRISKRIITSKMGLMIKRILLENSRLSINSVRSKLIELLPPKTMIRLRRQLEGISRLVG